MKQKSCEQPNNDQIKMLKTFSSYHYQPLYTHTGYKDTVNFDHTDVTHA